MPKQGAEVEHSPGEPRGADDASGQSNLQPDLTPPVDTETRGRRNVVLEPLHAGSHFVRERRRSAGAAATAALAWPQTSGETSRRRVQWTPELQQRFLNAVAHLGVNHAVPKAILNLINVDGLTRENVASHLQKFKLHLRAKAGLSLTCPLPDDIMETTGVMREFHQHHQHHWRDAYHSPDAGAELSPGEGAGLMHPLFTAGPSPTAAAADAMTALRMFGTPGSDDGNRAGGLSPHDAHKASASALQMDVSQVAAAAAAAAAASASVPALTAEQLNNLVHSDAFDAQFRQNAGVHALSDEALQAFVLGKTDELLSPKTAAHALMHKPPDDYAEGPPDEQT